MSNLWHNIRTS